MMKQSLVTLFSILILVVGLAPVAQADSAGAIKARMAQRLGQVVALKQNGSVGENNQGYLTARKALSGKNAALLAAENADRRAVYQIIAGKTKSSASVVGRTRAKSIRSSAPSGTWVQMPDGSWKKA